MADLPHGERSTVKRLSKRGVYDRDTICRILDEAPICHVGFAVEGQPFVIPTIHVRVGETVYLHGSPASRMLQTLKQGVEACLTATLLDGLVLARSAFHHSMNYRSAVIFGRASAVEDPDQKAGVLYRLSERLIPGRWAEVRRPSALELRQTLVVGLAIDEASAKVRTGPPLDDEADYELPVWAGVLPLHLAASDPVADPRLKAGLEVPDYVRAYRPPAPR